jgi:hypothetical protein
VREPAREGHRVKGDTGYVFLDGDLDVAAVPVVLEASHLALATDVARIVVDLGAVIFLKELCGLRDGLSAEPVVKNECGIRRSGSAATRVPR